MKSVKDARLNASVLGTLLFCAMIILPVRSHAEDTIPENPLRPAKAAAITNLPAQPVTTTTDNSAEIARALFNMQPAPTTAITSAGPGSAPQAQYQYVLPQNFLPHNAQLLQSLAAQAQQIRPIPAVTVMGIPPQQFQQAFVGPSPVTTLTQNLEQVPVPPVPDTREVSPMREAPPVQPLYSTPPPAADRCGCDGPCDGGCDSDCGCEGGCDGSCDSNCGCDGGCALCTEACKTSPIWEVGTEVLFLSPDMNSANTRYDVIDYFTPATHNFVVDDLDEMFAAPRIWLGIQGENWGVVGRFFRITAGHEGHDPFLLAGHGGPGLPGSDAGYFSSNLVDAYSIDLEVRRTFCFHSTKMYVGFGPRHARMEHDQSVAGFAWVEDDILTGTARSNRAAYGTGISLSTGGRKPLFDNSCAHFFFNLRAAILWGNTDVDVETSASLIDPTATAASYNAAAASLVDDMFIGEVQLGIQWDYELKWMCANAFFRIAGEYQYWDASQGYAVSASFADEGGVVDSLAFADADGLRMNLTGFSIATGFTW
ncbi:MAG TPA: hypothetical protein VMX74_11655 [Pirellulales bacterium]|nr:hypothetical protein [Pirellulales bacterium]